MCLDVEIRSNNSSKGGQINGGIFARGKEVRIGGASSRWPFYAAGGEMLDVICVEVNRSCGGLGAKVAVTLKLGPLDVGPSAEVDVL